MCGGAGEAAEGGAEFLPSPDHAFEGREADDGVEREELERHVEGRETALPALEPWERDGFSRDRGGAPPFEIAPLPFTLGVALDQLEQGGEQRIGFARPGAEAVARTFEG